MDEFKFILEQSVKAQRFSGNTLLDETLQLFRNRNYLETQNSILTDVFDEKGFKYVMKSILRNSFLIEIVEDKIATTLMKTRWEKFPSAGKKQEAFNSSDPRFSSFDECLKIFNKLISALVYQFNRGPNFQVKDLILDYKTYHVLPYELPIDYCKSTIPPGHPIHTEGNVDWFFKPELNKILLLRKALLDSEDEEFVKFFKKLLDKKIKVKTYLTDRVQTGEHKTNREKRWEVHPKSVHFGTRNNCMNIEYTLVNQICHFQGFPKEVFDDLIDSDLITNWSEPLY